MVVRESVYFVYEEVLRLVSEHDSSKPCLSTRLSEDVVRLWKSEQLQKKEGLGGSSQTKGVTADVIDERSTRIEFNVILEYGKSAPQAFEQIKTIIAKDLKDMTGLGIAEMVVNVVDVMTKEEYSQKRGNAPDNNE